MIEAPNYYDQDQAGMLAMARPGAKSIIEVGCASGGLLRTLIDQGATRVVGVEYVAAVAERAQVKVPEAKILAGDIDTLSDDDLGDGYDLAIMNFVLEHVTDPWRTLARIVSKLRPGGQLIGALPNVRHISVTLPLVIKGKWEYVDDGIMDRTHYRFFTRSTIIELLQSAGLQNPRLEALVGAPKSKLMNRLTLGALRDHFAYSIAFSADKPRT